MKTKDAKQKQMKYYDSKKTRQETEKQKPKNNLKE